VSGWIKIHRKITACPYWLDEPFTRGQAWVDMLLLANHKHGYIRVQGMRVDIMRGELGMSEVSLSERWKWSRGKVRRFLDELVKDGMIDKKTHEKQDRRKNVITVLNYDKYQSENTSDDTSDDTSDGQAAGQATVQEQEEVKNEKNEKKKKVGAKTPPGSTQKNGFDFSFSEDEHIKHLQDFVEMRRAIKKPITQKAIELNYKAFLKAADHFKVSFDEVVDFTIMKTWMSPNIQFMENQGFGVQKAAIVPAIRCHQCDNERNPNCINRTDEQRLKCTYFEEAVKA
jgi:predicted transcriptional regulator